MSKLIPQEAILKIKELRKQGYSLGEIKKVTGVGYGTVWRYIENVEILPEFRTRWLEKKKSSTNRRNKALEQVKLKAQETISSLSLKEKAIFISALYWGEGSKADFGLSNTDPNLITVFVKGLKEVFGIPVEDLKVSIRIYEDLDKQDCLEFWSKITGVPVNKFISIITLKGRKKGKLQYGMCRVRVTKGGDLLKYVTAIKNEVVTKF